MDDLQSEMREQGAGLVYEVGDWVDILSKFEDVEERVPRSWVPSLRHTVVLEAARRHFSRAKV